MCLMRPQTTVFISLFFNNKGLIIPSLSFFISYPPFGSF